MKRLNLTETETLYARISKDNKLFLEERSYKLRVSEAKIVNEILDKVRKRYLRKTVKDVVGE